MTSILHKIAEYKKAEVLAAKKNRPSATLAPHPTLAQRDFIAALQGRTTPAIIAEIKKASPSKGVIREDFNPAEIASIYADHGARCLSVLTDIHFFQGHPDYLATAKSHCALPVLRKDFIIDSYQIDESRALGADCLLLIVAMLDDAALLDFCQQAQELKMAVLVESHTAQEVERALRLPTPLIGINNRCLHTFKTDLNLSVELKKYIPEDRIIITESGINTREDILLMQSHEINTFLIGERLMRSANIAHELTQLMGQ